MPYYTFKNLNTNEITTTDLMKISELDPYRAAHPELELLPAAPGIGDPIRLGLTKADGRLQEKLQAIKSNHLHSKVNI